VVERESNADPTTGIAAALNGMLSPGAAELYVSMLDAHGRDVVHDHADAAELIAAGLASRSVETGGLFLFPPQVALTRALERRVRNWLDAAPDVTAMSTLIARSAAHVELAPTTSGSVEDITERQRIAESMLVGASREILVLQPWVPPDDEDDADTDGWTSTPDVHTAPDVAIRFVYEDRLLRIPGFEDTIRKEIELGAEVRITDELLPSFLMVVDGTTAAFTPEPDGPGEVTSLPGLVGLLRWTFEAFWTRALPIDPADDLSPTLRTVLALIGLGRTNKQIAHIIGTHERTVRRRVEELLEYFGESDRAGLIRHAATNAPV
jgi:DNA-binding CsgD family transcriptional regulator